MNFSSSWYSVWRPGYLEYKYAFEDMNLLKEYRCPDLHGKLNVTAVIDHLFFCQAEDGIRVDLVTGVQTCALPIYRRRARQSTRGPYLFRRRARARVRRAWRDRPVCARRVRRELFRCPWRWSWCSWVLEFSRSEERRIGKECRCQLGLDY